MKYSSWLIYPYELLLFHRLILCRTLQVSLSLPLPSRSSCFRYFGIWIGGRAQPSYHLWRRQERMSQPLIQGRLKKETSAENLSFQFALRSVVVSFLSIPSIQVSSSYRIDREREKEDLCSTFFSPSRLFFFFESEFNGFPDSGKESLNRSVGSMLFLY